MHRRVFLLAAFGLIGSIGMIPLRALTPALAAGDGPAATLTAIYARVSAGKGEDGGAFMLEAEDRPRYFSKALVKLWAAAEAKTTPGNVGPVDFDPISNSQDPLVKSFAVKTGRVDGARARVAVSISAKTGPVVATKGNTLDYEMVREGGRWMIDDISGMAGSLPWSLRKLLQAFDG